MPRLFLRIQLLALLFTLSVVSSAVAQQAPQYERRELRIPMRDGIELHTVVLAPTASKNPLPILFIRTPFGAGREFGSTELPRSLRELGEDGYIFVCQDIRGRSESGGSYVTMRALADPRDPKAIDEATDAYDSIEWLIHNLPGNSGKVGMLGVSYRGWLAGLAGINPHPALKAISPQGLMGDVWLGDDYMHQGAFRQTQGVAIAAFLEGDGSFPQTDYDLFSYYLRFPTLDSLARATGVAQRPTWLAVREHPAYDSYWQSRALQRQLTSPTVPMLFVGGAWDEEDILGPQLTYRTVERADSNHWNHFVLGPWSHRGWSMPGGDSLGPIRLGSNTADYYRSAIQRPWFAYHLHGKGDGNFPEAWAFETGANQWRTFESWPPKQSQPRKLYFRENGSLSFDPPRTTVAAFDSYRSDPAHPVPYTPRPDDGSGWGNWLQRDQRFVDNRPDVLTWQSAPLTEDLTIAGDVTAHLFASTTGSDADWVVKLIDVYPDSLAERSWMGGYQLMVNADIMRGRYWKGFERATPIPANRVTPFTVDLHQQLYRFQKGHRIMVQVQSSWFPLYDRNPQRFVANIFKAKASDYHAATHRVWRTVHYPSHLALPVLP